MSRPLYLKGVICTSRDSLSGNVKQDQKELNDRNLSFNNIVAFFFEVLYSSSAHYGELFTFYK